MNIQQMQQELISQISAVNNEDTLRMLSEELAFSLQSQAHLEELLTETDLAELKMLAEEPIDKNTMSLTEFNKVMDQWRMK